MPPTNVLFFAPAHRKPAYGLLLCLLTGLLWTGCRNSSQPVSTEPVDSLHERYLHAWQALWSTEPAPHNRALQYADSLLQLLEPYATHPRYNERYAQAQVRKGDVLMRQKRYDEACFFFYLGKRSLLPDADSCAYAALISDVDGRLANVAYRQERYKESIAANKTAVANMLHCGNGFPRLYNIQGILDNIGLGYSALGQADSALYYYNEALHFIETEAPHFPKDTQFIAIAKAVIYGNQGSAWLLKGDRQQAEQSFLRNIAINGRKGYSEEDALITRIKLADLYLQMQAFDKVKMLIEAIRTSTAPLADPPRLRFLKVQADYALAMQQPAAAAEYLQQYILRKNSMDTSNKKLMSTNFQLEMDLLHQRYEVDVLKKQGQLSNVYLVAALLLFIMALVILYLTLRSRRQARLHARSSHQHSEQLELMLTALEKSNQEHAELMRVVAHDLKNPLSVIYMLTELMTVQEGKPAEDLEMLQLIRGASMNMNTVIQELLTAKNAPDTSSRRREAADIRILLQQSVDLLRYRANKKNQQLVAAKHPACIVDINYEQIWRVINNLLVNAIKFSPENTTIRVEWVILPTEVVIQIQDQGIGIAPELQEQIFEQFSPAQRAGTSGEQPFGMGLYISRQIVEAHDGRIWVESIPGRGSSFFVALRR